MIYNHNALSGVQAHANGWKHFANSIKQQVKPEKYDPRLSNCFLITKSYSYREINMSKHTTENLSMPESEAGIANEKKRKFLRGLGAFPLKKFCKSRLKSAQFEAFWRQIWEI